MSDPVVRLELDRETYRRTQVITATFTETDADNRTEDLTLTGRTPEGLQVTEQVHRQYTDPYTSAWYWESAPAAVFAQNVNPLQILAPPASDVLVVSVVDSTGRRVEARAEVVVSSLVVGVDFHDSTASTADADLHLSRSTGLYKTSRGRTKIFTTATRGLPSWTSGMISHVPSEMGVTVAFVDMPTEAQYRAWLAGLTVPNVNRWPVINLDWLQEGDRKVAPDVFVSNWLKLISWSDDKPENVKLMPNFTWYWEHFKNGDDWQEFWPAGADVMGWDIYPGGKANWLSPEEVCALPLSAAQAAGVPIEASEFGVVTADTSSASLEAQAAWMSGVLTELDSGGAIGASWWCAKGDQGNFHQMPGMPGYEVLTSWMPGA